MWWWVWLCYVGVNGLPHQRLCCDEVNTSVGSTLPMTKFLELLQDYSVDLCLHGSESTGGIGERGGADGGQCKRRDKRAEGPSGRLYHSHSVVSAISAGKQLLTVKGRPLAHSQKPSQVILSKEDNSGICTCWCV